MEKTRGEWIEDNGLECYGYPGTLRYNGHDLFVDPRELDLPADDAWVDYVTGKIKTVDRYLELEVPITRQSMIGRSHQLLQDDGVARQHGELLSLVDEIYVYSEKAFEKPYEAVFRCDDIFILVTANGIHRRLDQMAHDYADYRCDMSRPSPMETYRQFSFSVVYPEQFNMLVLKNLRPDIEKFKELFDPEASALYHAAKELLGEDVRMPAGLDDCCIGYVHRCSQEPFLVYDAEKCIHKLMEDGLTYHEAAEHLYTNYIGAWMGPQTEGYLERIDLEAW